MVKKRQRPIKYYFIEALLTGESYSARHLQHYYKTKTKRIVSLSAIHGVVRAFKYCPIGSILIEHNAYNKVFSFKKEALNIELEELYNLTSKQYYSIEYVQKHYPFLLTVKEEEELENENLLAKLLNIIQSGKLEITIKHYIYYEDKK